MIAKWVVFIVALFVGVGACVGGMIALLSIQPLAQGETYLGGNNHHAAPYALSHFFGARIIFGYGIRLRKSTHSGADYKKEGILPESVDGRVFNCLDRDSSILAARGQYPACDLLVDWLMSIVVQ